ncbi:YggW family oxidoreductase, partial [Acinetobacter nosocomialis]
HLHMKQIEADELPFEFMMNTLRLNDGVKADLYKQRTGLSLDDLNDVLTSLRARKLLVVDSARLACTEQGHIFLNSVLEEFL